MTLGSAQVILAEYREAHVRDDALTLELLHQYLARLLLGDVHVPRLQELAIGELREVFLPALHADESLDVTPPGRHIRIPDRPVDADAVALICREILIAPAKHAAAPHDGAAA